MTKGKWYTRAISVTIALSFILGSLVVAPSVSAAHLTSQWERQATPTEKDLVILPGSDIIDMAVGGTDGKTIYAIGVWYDICADEADESWAEEFGPMDLFSEFHKPKLWKSTDGGVTWKDQTSKVLGANNLPELSGTTDPWANPDAQDFTFFTTVAVAPDDPNFVVVGGWGYDDDADVTLGERHYIPIVVGSNDGATKFYWMGCGNAIGFITALDVSMEVDGGHNIAVGTWDWEAESPNSDAIADGGVFGGTPDYAYANGNAKVWRYESGSYWSAAWVDTSMYPGWAASDVVADLKFSPNFDVDDTIVVLTVGDATDSIYGPYKGYWIQAGVWGNQEFWNVPAGFGSHPVLITRDNDILVSGIDPLIGSGWDIGPLVRRLGHLALPSDYMGDMSSGRKFMVAVNGLLFQRDASFVSDGGYIFWMENTKTSLEMLEHEDNPYIASIAYHGDKAMMGKTLVGLAFPRDWDYNDIMDWYNGSGVGPDMYLPFCSGVQVLRSETTDVCCPAWDEACKPPTGQLFATVKYTPDGMWAYAGTQGESRLWGFHNAGWWADESAFSISGHEDVLGNAWNQSGLIDTDIDFIADVEVASDDAGAAACASACSCLYIGTINYSDAVMVILEDDEDIIEELTPDTEGKVAGCDSIWRTCDNKAWLRIWNKALTGSPMEPEGPDGWMLWGDDENPVEWMVLGLAPEEKGDVKTIYMADLGSDAVWYSVASGNACCPAGLGCWTSRNPGIDEIADIAVLNASTIYVVDFNGDMVKSTTGGRHWSSTVDTKVDGDTGEWAHHMVAVGDWVMLGGDMGTVTYSKDGGATFTELDDIGNGQVHVAFDSYFSANGYVYAAIAGPDRGIYRTTITQADFEDMEACDMDYHGIVVSDPNGNPKTSASTGGVLYASYNGSETCVSSGVARLLNPAAEPCCGALSWDYLFDELCDEDIYFVSQPNDIAICGDQSGSNATIWAIDVQPTFEDSNEDSYYLGWNDCYTAFSQSCFGRLWKFTDVFANAGPTLIGVANGSTTASDDCDCVNACIILEWDRICDACEYDIEIAFDSGFKHKVWTVSTISGVWPGANVVTHETCEGILGCESPQSFFKPSDPCAPSIVVPTGVFTCSTQYFWRVRARVAETGEAYRSQWSDVWSFTVATGPGGAIQLTAPDDGATNVPRQNLVFTWTAVSGATGYEMTIWDSMGAEVASSSGTATSYVLTETLDYDSAYTWQVVAMKGTNAVSTSQVSTFRTMMSPTPPPTIPETIINFPEPAGTPSWVWVVIALAAILIIVVIVLIFRTRRV